jgi:signal transduction histidine kinase
MTLERMPVKKNIDLTSVLSLTAFFLALLLSAIYYFNPGNNELAKLILIVSGLFFMPYALNRVGLVNTSKFLFAYFTPTIIVAISIINKQFDIQSGINAISYYDVRILLFVTIIIPFAIFEIEKKLLLTLAMIPSMLCIFLFDVIHNLFDVGFYDAGLESPDYYLSSNLYSIITYVFIAIAFIFLKKQSQNSEDRYLRKSEKLQNYLDKVVALSRSQSIQNGEVTKVAREIIATVVESMNTTRSSVWRYNQETNWLECVGVFEKGTFLKNEAILDCDEFPAYLEEIRKKKILLADDALNYPALRELNEYLQKNEILAMMDVPFFHNGELGGVICVEHQHETRHWSAEDTIFLKALSDLLSYTIVTDKLTRQYQIIKEKSEEINAINEHLESRISDRTRELENKNEQLSEYAFLNSHKLRGPIARIEGLFNVIELTQTDKIPDEILEPIRDSINELDQVSRQINRSIEHYGKMSRKQVEEVISKN